MLAETSVLKHSAYERICFSNPVTSYLWVTEALEAASHSLKQWFVQYNSDSCDKVKINIHKYPSS